MIKLIATDMDGTLLNNNHEVSEGFFDILSELKENGIILSIATGRSYVDALSKVKEYKDDLMFICENGSVIYYKNECIFSHFLNKYAVKELVEIGRTVDDAYTVLSGEKAIYVEDDEVLRLAKDLFSTQAPIIKVDSLLDVKDNIFKVNMLDMKEAEKNSYEYFKNCNIENISIVASGLYWLDIMSSETNKGVAIKNIQEKFNIDYTETMVFGDYLNDLEMMKRAHYSYAMKNGHEKVKEIANFETEHTNNENGVIRTINSYLSKKLNLSK